MFDYEVLIKLCFKPTSEKEISALRKGNTSTETSYVKSSSIDKKLITGEDWNSYFRETYGAKNVTWENPVNSIDEIIDTPSLVTRFQPKQLAEFAEESGWNVGPLKNGGKKGILFEDGGGFAMNRIDGKTDYIQYHPGGGHHGENPYFKVSSSKRGTNRFNLNGDVMN